MTEVATVEVANGERTRLLGKRGVFIQILASNDLQLGTLRSTELNGFWEFWYYTWHQKPPARLARTGISSILGSGPQSRMDRRALEL